VKDSTKRAIRTGLHVLIAAAIAVPSLLALLPGSLGTDPRVVAVAAGVVAVSVIVSKVYNALEEAGLLPGWLKSTPPQPPPDDAGEVTIQEIFFTLGSLAFLLYIVVTAYNHLH
jgi:hypothetical protein